MVRAYVAGYAVFVSTEEELKISDREVNILFSFFGIFQLTNIHSLCLSAGASTVLHLQSSEDIVSFVDSRR